MNLEVNIHESEFLKAVESYKEMSVKKGDVITIVHKEKEVNVEVLVEEVNGSEIIVKSLQS